MYKRPRLSEAISTLEQIAHISEDAADSLVQYFKMRADGHDFAACHMVVEIVAAYHNNISGVANG